MFRELFHLGKTSKESPSDADPGAAPSQIEEILEFDFDGNYSWGDFHMHLEIVNGIIKDAYASSDRADSQLMEMIGVYLEARKYERKEILNILDMIPVKDEKENTIMRDIYNLVDEKLDE